MLTGISFASSQVDILVHFSTWQVDGLAPRCAATLRLLRLSRSPGRRLRRALRFLQDHHRPRTSRPGPSSKPGFRSLYFGSPPGAGAVPLRQTGPIAVHRLWEVAPTLEEKVPDVRHYRRLFQLPLAERIIRLVCLPRTPTYVQAGGTSTRLRGQAELRRWQLCQGSYSVNCRMPSTRQRSRRNAGVIGSRERPPANPRIQSLVSWAMQWSILVNRKCMRTQGKHNGAPARPTTIREVASDMLDLPRIRHKLITSATASWASWTWTKGGQSWKTIACVQRYSVSGPRWDWPKRMKNWLTTARTRKTSPPRAWATTEKARTHLTNASSELRHRPNEACQGNCPADIPSGL